VKKDVPRAEKDGRGYGRVYERYFPFRGSYHLPFCMCLSPFSAFFRIKM
jgi:hypothetical protein